jgi:hypothetical protein
MNSSQKVSIKKLSEYLTKFYLNSGGPIKLVNVFSELNTQNTFYKTLLFYVAYFSLIDYSVGPVPPGLKI